MKITSATRVTQHLCKSARNGSWGNFYVWVSPQWHISSCLNALWRGWADFEVPGDKYSYTWAQYKIHNQHVDINYNVKHITNLSWQINNLQRGILKYVCYLYRLKLGLPSKRTWGGDLGPRQASSSFAQISAGYKSTRWKETVYLTTVEKSSLL